MPFNKQLNNELLKPAEDMGGFSFDFRKFSSKRQSSSKTAKESSVLPQLKPSPKDAGKFKSKNVVGPQHSDLKQKAKQIAEGKIQNREGVKRSVAESDELVKHMSHLPGYLLHTDKGEKFQEKAFNVGVLDWSLLEQWKHKHMHTPVPANNFTSFNSSESSSSTATKSSTSVGGKKKLDNNKGLLSSGSRPSYRECPPESTKVLNTPLAFESFGKTHSDISLEKERRSDYTNRTSHVGKFASNLRHQGVSHVPSENANARDDGTKQNMKGLQEYNHKKKESNHKASYDMGQPPVKSKGKGFSFSSKEMSSSSGESRRKVDQLPEPDFDIGSKHSYSKPSNFVPQEIQQSSSSEDFRLSELRTSSDENFSESSQSSLSHVSLPEDIYNEIPHSSALPSVSELNSSETIQHRMSNGYNKFSSLQSTDACFEKDVSLDNKLRNQCALRNLKKSLDQETAELTSQRGMNPSHNRRFSFSLSRIGRSFSFKEGPTLPQLSSMHISAKSGPVTPQTSVRWDDSSKVKANSNNRTRSSPLRRLLDPIWKHKASDIHHSAESSQRFKGSMSSISFATIDVNESLHDEQSKESSVEGLLQLTIKNGLPLFKFVLNNERKIFAATMKSLASPEKDDSGCSFTFYLVNEIKKKSGGWISHGSKEKSCGYAYNIVAQMKFSSSKITEPINQDSKRQLLIKEFVLSGVEMCHIDQGKQKFIHSRELASVVIETPFENISNEGLPGDKNLLKKECLKCLGDGRCLCNSGENGDFGSATVILPGGVHGSPNKGEPSPLIYRWKTGGQCDCGGWDIGCKLLVLSNQKQSSNAPKSSKLYHDRFQLFVQEGAEQDTPLFTLSPLKDGLYSIEFNPIITHLQAFFISVAVLSCQKLPSSFEMSSMPEEIIKEPSSKNNSRVQGKAPVKYTPIPPLSPVGRV